METTPRTRLDRIEELWKRFNDYKEVAQQYEFAIIAAIDMQLTPLYEDLKKNPDPNHEKILLGTMKKYFLMTHIISVEPDEFDNDYPYLRSKLAEKNIEEENINE